MIIIKLQSEDKSKPKLYSDLRKVQLDNFIPSNFGSNYYIHKMPRFPQWMKNKIYRYADHRMDLFNLKCDCNSQQQKREYYKGRDIRLLCKHLYYKILKTSAVKELDSLTIELMKNAVIWGEQHLYKYVYKNKDIIFGFKEDTDWINVYAPNVFKPEEHKKYSFNPLKHRWSYDSKPDDYLLFEDLIKRIIKNNLPFEHSYISILKTQKQN